MSDSPIISVLIPVYNSAEHLRLCMNSLINQSFEDYEIIAVNNGSEDNSLEILEEYAQEYPDTTASWAAASPSPPAAPWPPRSWAMAR